MNSDTNARFFGLFGLGVIAVWLTLGLGSNFYLCLASLRWPKVPALITSSGLNTGTSNIGTWWAPDVEYRYEVGGATYRGANIRYLMPSFYREEPATAVQAPYPPGLSIEVAYDPQNPGRSVLEPGVPAGMWKQALIPAFFWVLVSYILFEINHPKRRILLRSNPEAENFEEEDEEAKAA